MLIEVLAIQSYAERAALRLVCKRWRAAIASKEFAVVRAVIGETGTVIVGAGDDRDMWRHPNRSVSKHPSWLIIEGRLLRGPGMPTSDCVVGNSCVVMGNTVVVVGGYDGDYWDDEQPQCHAHVLDVSRGTWSRLPAPPDAGHGVVPVEAPALGVLRGRLFCAGGGCADPRRSVDDGEDPRQEPPVLPGGVYEYDPEMRAWRARSDMPVPVRGAAFATVENRLIVIGGTDFGEGIRYPGSQVEHLQIYDADQDSWTLAAVPRGRACAHAAVIGDEIYYSGGIDEGISQRWVEALDLETLSVRYIKPPGFEDARDDWDHDDPNLGAFPEPPGPCLSEQPTGVIDSQYVALGKENAIWALGEDGSWTRRLQIPGPDLFPCPMVSNVPLI